MHACRRAHMEHPYRTENGSENESTAAVPRARFGGPMLFRAGIQVRI